MSIKTKEVRICDVCGRETGDDFFQLEAYPNEGPSTMSYSKKSYDFDDKDFCSFNCFITDIKLKLNVK